MIYFCQGCSAVLSHRLNFCPHCGEKQFYNDECDYCGADISETDDYCPECGDHINRDEDNLRTCPECGFFFISLGTSLSKEEENSTSPFSISPFSIL